MKTKRTFNSQNQILVIGKLPSKDHAACVDSLTIFKDFYRGIEYLSDEEAVTYNEMSCAEIIARLNCDVVAFLNSPGPPKVISYVSSDFFSDWLKSHIHDEKQIKSFYNNVISSRYQNLIKSEEKENKLFFEYFLGG